VIKFFKKQLSSKKRGDFGRADIKYQTRWVLNEADAKLITAIVPFVDKYKRPRNFIEIFGHITFRQFLNYF
jgi:hypothetical protein